ncbi:MAG: diguanylate cyclase [Chloroflexi bacterium]|nr:diguanylate cyclase [Chloroflexota bacterium]
MYVRFWGTRGSIPTPGPSTARYGGNTSCVEVIADDGTHIILDCGTGARELGLHLLSSGVRPLRLHLFIGHTHWDHIQGFPFFIPAFLPDVEMNIYGAAGFQRSLEDAMAGQMQYTYFPVKLHDLRSRLHFTELEEGFFRVGEVLVETQYINHTAPTMAYRISSGGATVVYVTDHEPFWVPTGPTLHHPGDQRHIAFLHGADLVIHDAQYTQEEYSSKLGWGHSTIEYATDVALAAGVARLALFHHDPAHADAMLERLEQGARARVAARDGALDVFAAAEGLELDVRGRGRAPLVVAASALRRRPIAGGRVLMVSTNETDILAIEQVLEEDGLVLLKAPDQQVALAQITDLAPDLIILDVPLPGEEAEALIAALRARLGRRTLPVLLLTEHTDGEAAVGSGDAGTTDCLAKPFSPPMLRTRVRAWLARTQDESSKRTSVEASGSAGAANAAVAADTSPLGSAAIREQASLLAAIPLFRSLSREHLDTLAALATQETYPPGRVVIEQGQPSDQLFVLLSGRVRIVEAVPETPHVEMAVGELGPGEVFGELGILDHQARSASVLTLESTRCLVLPAADFLRVLRDSADLALGLLRVLAGRLHDADRRLARYAPDPLTGLASRRTFHDQYRRLAASAQRRQSGVVLLLLDVVNLKTINDRFGYAVGDEVLRTLADALVSATRGTDLVARYGGDEFAALLVDAQPGDAKVVMERVRHQLAALAPRRGLPLAVHYSIGIAASTSPPEAVDELLRAADQDMHRTKSTAPPDYRSTR